MYAYVEALYIVSSNDLSLNVPGAVALNRQAKTVARAAGRHEKSFCAVFISLNVLAFFEKRNSPTHTPTSAVKNETEKMSGMFVIGGKRITIRESGYVLIGFAPYEYIVIIIDGA